MCKNYFNKYDTFEDKIEELFKKKKIDLASTIYEIDKALLHDFRKAAKVTKVTPQNDFYSYINDKWLKDYQLQESQKYIVQVDNFRITQDKVFRELIEIVKDYIKDNKTPLAKNMKNYYEAIMKQNTLKQARYYADYFVNNVDELRKDKSNLWNLLGLINQHIPKIDITPTNKSIVNSELLLQMLLLDSGKLFHLLCDYLSVYD